MNTKRLIVDWKGLKELGWPYSRAHTWRMMAAGSFPQAFKLTNHPHSHPVWKVSDILAHLESRGLVLTNVDAAS
jgi:predicted DNA-binding transcriptional regulator AlpA